MLVFFHCFSFSIAMQPELPTPPEATTPETSSNHMPVTCQQVNELRSCIKQKTGYFDRKSRTNKLGASGFKLVIVVSSVLTPILIGWHEGNPRLVNLGLISSAVTAGATALYNFYDNKDLWVQFKVSRNELEALLAELNYREAAGLAHFTQAQLEMLFNRYVAICSETNVFYRTTRLTPDEKAEKAPPAGC
jgi:hypothetical protein